MSSRAAYGSDDVTMVQLLTFLWLSFDLGWIGTQIGTGSMPPKT